MTPDERKKLEETYAMTKEVHDKLFKEQPDGTPPFYDRAVKVVKAIENGSWAIKWSVRIIVAAGAVVTTLAAAFGALKFGWFMK